MKSLFQTLAVLFAISVVQIYGVCNIGFGKHPPTGIKLHTLHARNGPVAEPKNMSLVFDYAVSPVENVEISYVDITTSLEGGCTFSHPADGSITKGFKITVSTHAPVLEMSGTATVYGMRYGNW
ncbi:hypothetical protein RP20_CCG026450 [Aedes albopictus]|nr:uncharacterized protein LOC109412436 [Aedes albopictus]XP_019561934.1 uncharacterized protein LOC109430333 [Aedes albopictus]KXJ80127.1 hypothetical protein RP20_CCG026450 [Aedes albopictus]